MTADHVTLILTGGTHDLSVSIPRETWDRAQVNRGNPPSGTAATVTIILDQGTWDKIEF